MKKFVIFIMFFLLVALYEVSSRERVKEHKDYEPSRISISGQSITESIKNKKDGSFERHIEKSNEALTYQKSLIRPYLDMFFENPVKCEVIKNNEQALVEYKKILAREDCPNIEKELGLDLSRKQKISHIINLELEKDIQDITKGRICLRYPNPTTFKALVEIWKSIPVLKPLLIR